MKQSIEFDTTVDDVLDVALAVAFAYGYESVEGLLDDVDDAVEDEVPEVVTYPDGWTPAKMRRYVDALTPNAQVVLRTLAENAPDVDADDVREMTGLEGPVYAGSMSSFGYAARNTRGVKSKPFKKFGKRYEMPTEVAQLVLSVFEGSYAGT